MAISQTMSNPRDWILHSYQNDFSTLTHDQIATHSAIISTNTTAAASSSSSSSRNYNLTPDHGRVSKPLRRRPRASRRTPTTLLNTDTTNFRALVQQFTGGPSAAASWSQLPSGGATLGLTPHITTASVATASPASGFRLHYYPNQMQQQRAFMMDHNMYRGGGPSTQAALPVNENWDGGNYVVLR